MRSPILALALALSLSGLATAAVAENPAPGPTAPAKLKKTPSAAAGVTVTVTNGRKVDLVQLQAAESNSAVWKKVLGPLKAGKQASAMFPQGVCRVNLHGTFANGESMDASDVDVCAEKTLNLTE